MRVSKLVTTGSAFSLAIIAAFAFKTESKKTTFPIVAFSTDGTDESCVFVEHECTDTQGVGRCKVASVTYTRTYSVSLETCQLHDLWTKPE